MEGGPSRDPQGLGGERQGQQAGSEGVLVSATGFGTWEMKAGDPTAFCLSVAFMPNPDGADDRADADERDSWGNFALWAGGENLCAHIEQGEEIQAAHWYMLPLLEWLADNWDPLLHEERLPLRNAGASAAESLTKTRLPPVTLKEVDDFEWMDSWSEWWTRHSIRAAREGGLFPDIYLRRYRDRLEISTGAEPLPGIPSDFRFLAPNRSYNADLTSAADAVYQVLSAAVQELRRRLPFSSRVAALAEKTADLTSLTAEPRRMAWLAGIGERYSQVAHAVGNVLSTADARVRQAIIGSPSSSPLVVVGSAYARLLYGAVSPTTGLDDVMLMTRSIIDNYVDDATPWLSELDLPLDAADIGQLSPGEQGSRLGEKACELLGTDGGGWVDIKSILESLDIARTDIELSDAELRAVSVFGSTQRPHIFLNKKTRWAQSNAAKRFTLAHELCHLLLDREYGDELAIASGPWAPVAIEQRANAFAAAFLMPTWLLRHELTKANAPADDLGTIQSVSSSLRVSVSSLVDRLYNLGELTSDERFHLRSVWPQERDH
jgi:Zn-dependent peptidase ImmA (M78 family)